MKKNEVIFNQYIQPRGLIPLAPTEIHGLSGEGGKLYRYGYEISCAPRNKVLENFLEFLESCVGESDKKCMLIADNSSFDAPRLLRIIDAAGMRESFGKIISGFCDTPPLLQVKFPERKTKGSLTLTTLATETLSIDIKNAHDAVVDVYILEQLVLHHLSLEDLDYHKKSFYSDHFFSWLDHLSRIISKDLRKKNCPMRVFYLITY